MKTEKNREYSFVHTRDKAKERYGIDDLTRADWENWARLCTQENKTKDEGVQSIHRIKHDGWTVIVVLKHAWNKQERKYASYVSTCLPIKLLNEKFPRDSQEETREKSGA